jgi:hypothetical protein
VYIYSICSLFYESNFFKVLGEAQGYTGLDWNKGLPKATKAFTGIRACTRQRGE